MAGIVVKGKAKVTIKGERTKMTTTAFTLTVTAATVNFVICDHFCEATNALLVVVYWREYTMVESQALCFLY